INRLSHLQNQPIPENDCGYSQANPKSIQKDQFTIHGEFPWLVAIFSVANNAEKFIGSGSILAPTAVLTAANVVYSQDARSLVIHAGEWDANSLVEPYPYQSRRVDKAICHQSFNASGQVNDVALLLLKKPFRFNPFAKSICMPRLFEYEANKPCIVVGWNSQSFSSDTTRNIPLKIEVSLTSSTQCQKSLQQTFQSGDFQLHDSFVCAATGSEARSNIISSSAPLYCPSADHPGQYYQMGILVCMYQNSAVHSTYTSVSHLKLWIYDTLKENSIDPNYYMTSYMSAYNEH
ncbi:hypothetical protein KR222_002860, partial [Zaprionus bogoriensis]